MMKNLFASFIVQLKSVDRLDIDICADVDAVVDVHVAGAGAVGCRRDAVVNAVDWSL